MTIDFDTTRADLRLVARVVRDLGDKDIRKGLRVALDRATLPLREAAKAEASRRLPRRGGLAARVANSKLTATRRGGQSPAVYIRARGMDQLNLMDDGQVRHPVYGKAHVWVEQQITPGWFTDPMMDGKDETAEAVSDVLRVLAVQTAARIKDIPEHN